MVEDDVQLIQKVLSGDDEAFTALVRKHHKSVHALAWRKVGDFHFAEEITQDVFLRAYKYLSTLKDPTQFSGWLYVITDRLCKNWFQNKKSEIKSLEDVPVIEMQRTSYERYVSEQNEQEVHAHRQELVRRLLAKLPESERTVMTLYYLGEMTAKEIGNFLGVSVNTITSRLSRARERLKQDEELMVRELLGSVQLSDSLTERIAQRVADVKPTPSPNWKPFLPWMAFGAAAVLVILLLGASNQYLLRFQRPYSFEAESEPTVEIIDTPVVLDIEAKPAVRNQAGRAVTTDDSSGAGVQVSDAVSASDAQDASVRLSASQWTQATGPRSGPVFDVFATSDGTLYAFSQTGLYKLKPDAPAWTLVNSSVPIEGLRVPMADHRNTLYFVSNDAVFTSTDEGATWNTLCARPEGEAMGFVVTDEAQRDGSQVGIAMYLAIHDKGIFHFTDAVKEWTLLNDGLMDRIISAVAVIGGTVFAGTDKGLYRFDAGVWERLLVDVSGSVYSLAVAGNSLYAGTGPDFLKLQQIESKSTEVMQTMHDDSSSLSRIFHSADLGVSWTEITPTDDSRPIMAPSGINLLVAGETILAQAVTRFRSRDGGKTWTNLGFDMDSFTLNALPSVAVDENTFYKAGRSGIHRTMDGGESWHLFMDGIVGTRILDLVAVSNRLYAHTGDEIVQSKDSGESWEVIRFGANVVASSTGQSRPNFSPNSRLTITGNTLYVISPEKGVLHVSRLSGDGDVFSPVQEIPAFEIDASSIGLLADRETAKQVHLSEEREKHENPVETSRRKEHERIGAFMVSGEMFYVEYKRKLFKWQPGNSEWKDTGLVDTGEPSDEDPKYGFKLAVSGETVYVGKRNGRLFQSLDGGDSWRDVTSSLPRSFTGFKAIVFAGSTVYVATDNGVLASQTGAHWRVIADDVIVDRLAVNGLMVYGAGESGVYRLDVHGKWEQISPRVPGKVLALVVDRDRLYVATERRGLFHISLVEESYTASHK
jgi:RNA polymerase sigma factor (sigma-70 family)